MKKFTNRNLSFTQKFVLKQSITSGIINFFLNAWIASLIFRKLKVIPLWGDQSIGGDTIATSFLLPFITTLLIAPLIKLQFKNSIFPEFKLNRILNKLPKKTFPLSLTMGILCTITFAPFTIFLLNSFTITELGFRWFIFYKAGFAAVLAALITPIIGLCILNRELRAEDNERI